MWGGIHGSSEARDRGNTIIDIATPAALRDRQRTAREHQGEALAIRLHRAISWLLRAEADGTDDDTRFIHLWIAFNAAYAGEFDFEQSERAKVTEFLARIVAADSHDVLHALLFKQFTGPVRTLIDNRYVFAPFWRALREHDASEQWKKQFDASRKAAMHALLGGRTADLLGIVMDRLYVLRNQLVHGGATWNSSVNRAQLRDGCNLLASLVPAILAIVMESPAFGDDAIAYPVVPEYSSTALASTPPVNTAACFQGPPTATGTVATTD